MGIQETLKDFENDRKVKNYDKYVNEFRKKYVPDKYNQISLVDELLNEDIDHYIAISNRSDGKSFNYIQFFIKFAIDYGVKFMLISRNYTVRDSYQELMQRVIDKSPAFDNQQFGFINSQYYRALIYQKQRIAIITDLNSATNLKYLSNFLADYPIIVYDEFLAIEGDYLSDEWTRLETIYSSVDRNEDIPFIRFPKLFYLGNAVNFSSPILSELKLFNIIENHEINSIHQYNNILLDIRKNQQANDRRNLRAFNMKDDEMTNAQFKINKHNLASEDDRKLLNRNHHQVVVKLSSNYLVIHFNLDENIIVLSLNGHFDYYDFNIELSDNLESSTYLTDKYFKDEHFKKHDRGAYLYDNQYTKENVTSDLQLVNLDIMKLIRETYYTKIQTHSQREISEKQLERNYIEDSKRALFKKFME